MKFAVYNPHDKPEEELPVIYGFNNGGEPGWMHAQLLSQDGHGVGSHLCSHEVYMPGDLGCLEGHRPDRHEGFREIYPDGYRMEFVPSENIKDHVKFQEVLVKAKAVFEAHRAEEAAKAEAGEASDG